MANFFKDWNHRRDVADLLFEDENFCVFVLARHVRAVGDEVRRDVAFVELHSVNVLDVGFSRLAFFNGDDTVLADSFECFGKKFTDFVVVVGTDRTDVGNFFLFGNLLGH